MAKEKARSFPMLPVGHWWTLRDKFKQSIPGVVTDNYLAAALNTQTRSARANVLPYLKNMGLIDDDGKTQELGKAWRDDEQYAGVCQKMRKELYPDDLISAVPNPSEDRIAVERWFANHTGAGDAAVKRMSAIYMVISDGDISKKPQKEAKKEGGTPKKRAVERAEKKIAISGSTPPPSVPVMPSGGTPVTPGLNINLEIHISSDATPDQIDKIFESMAKHLYKK